MLFCFEFVFMNKHKQRLQVIYHMFSLFDTTFERVWVLANSNIIDFKLNTPTSYHLPLII